MQLTVERLFLDADADCVWAVASDLTSYPSFMAQVVSVEPVALDDGGQGTSWTVLFNGNELRWEEEDQFFPDERRMTFRQREGDLAVWQGSFQATSRDADVLARYTVEFDLGIPALAHVLHPLAERAIRANCEQMLNEIERAIGSRARHSDAV